MDDDRRQLERAATALQLQQELIEAQQVEIVRLRLERDRALMTQALLVEIRGLVTALNHRLVGV